ncbi:MAG: hypothetical protein M1821_001331 [Bathelium mastoideum]|nr:MAG: hypothetical protein M1821_001331 [Bathelium mastoideum]KAI9689856.1 MAG: hypothetical protein M1822_009738 [Bathelium mastoideum]
MGNPAAIDASALVDSTNESSVSASRREFGRQLAETLQRQGFAVLRNHGIEAWTIAEMFRAHEQFFALPLTIKQSVAHIGGSAPARGYSPYGKEKTYVLRPDIAKSPPRALDAREQFAIGPPEDEDWPTPWVDHDVAPGMRETITSFYTKCRLICQEIVGALELGLSVPPGTFLQRYLPDAAELNFNYYPAISLSQLQQPGVMRIWPHSDLGIVSILFQDREGGLEFQDREQPGSFVPVNHVEDGDMIVNVADTLERWTNGTLTAGVHQVVPPTMPLEANGHAQNGQTEKTVPARRSAVMFYRASGGTSVGPMPEFVTGEWPARYDDITAMQYLQSKNRHLY